MTQENIIKEVIGDNQMSIKEVAQETGIKEPSIRRVLGQGVKKGTFTRVTTGVYAITIGGKSKAIISVGNSIELIKRLENVNYKFDMVFLDIPYNTPAVKGGNRGVKYDLISVEEFRNFLIGLKKVIHKDTSVYHMFSQAESGWKKMEQYNLVLLELGFIKTEEGGWQKLFKNGKPCSNMRGDIMKREGLHLYNQSGKQTPDLVMDFASVRPRTASQKCSEMIKTLVLQSTSKGDRVLDPFAGTGITGEVCLKEERNIMLFEKSKDRVDNEIIPRLQSLIN